MSEEMKPFKQGLRNDHREHPVMKIPLEDRVTTPEEREVYEGLQKDAAYIREKLHRSVRFMDERFREPLPDTVMSLLVLLARDARKLGRHYDRYHVGGALVGLRTPTAEDPNPWVVIFNANTRPDGQTRKHCAEQYMLDDAEEMKAKKQLEHVVALVVVAPPRKMPHDPVGLMDDVSQKKQITLTPCEMCRARIMEMTQQSDGLVSARNTEVVTARADEPGLRKSFKAGDVPIFHGEGDARFESIGGDD